MIAPRRRAIAMMLEGRFRRAQDLLERALEEEPESVEVRFELACARLAQGKARTPPTNPGDLFDSDLNNKEESRRMTADAFLRYAEGSVGDALQPLQDACLLDPQNVIALNTLGRNYAYLTMDRLHARRCLRDVIRLAPSAIAPHLDLANVLIEEGDNDGAIDIALGLVEEHKGDLRSWFALAAAEAWASGRRRVIIVGGTSLLTFVPFVGPIAIVMWASLAILGLIVLRRARGALAGALVALTLPTVPAFCVRWLLLGRLFP
jgi:predicted Zn-dependent protease